MNCKCEEKKCGHWIEDELVAEDFFEKERLNQFSLWMESDTWKYYFDNKNEAIGFGLTADIEFFIGDK